MDAGVCLRIASVAVVAWLAAPSGVSAQSNEEFYKGRTIQLLVGYPAGAAYDINARLLARHLGKFIPGNPGIVVQNMTGAGSTRVLSYLNDVAPKDGTVFGMVGRGVALEPLLGNTPTTYDARRFTWIGSVSDEVSLCVTWKTSKVKTWNDMLNTDFTLGGEGPGSDPDIFAMAASNIFGVKTRLIAGYAGGSALNLAMERGEIDGRCGWSWSAIKGTKPDWLENRNINLLVQMALQGTGELKGVPLIMDVAKSERDRKILRLILSRQQMAWPFVAPPDLPPERARALREAFDATMKDPTYLEEAEKRRIDVKPMSGTAINGLIEELYATDADLIQATRAAIGSGK